MGFFSKLASKMPGNPTSVAKVILKRYLEHRSQFPNAHKKEAFRYVLKCRYAVIKSMNEAVQELYVAQAEALGDLVCCVVGHETPAQMERLLREQTVKDLYEFFMRHAPDEIGDRLKNEIFVLERNRS